MNIDRTKLVRIATALILTMALTSTFFIPQLADDGGTARLLATAEVAEVPAATLQTNTEQATESDTTLQARTLSQAQQKARAATAEDKAVEGPIRINETKTAERQKGIATAGDSSMMFMNAAIAEKLGPTFIGVPEKYKIWTSGTGGFDRNGCGVVGDGYSYRFTPSDQARPMFKQHGVVPEETCDWRRWIPQSLSEVNVDTLIVSFGPTSMWGFDIDGKSLDLRDKVVHDIVINSYRDLIAEAKKSGVKNFVWIAYPHISDPTVEGWFPDETQIWNIPEVANASYEILRKLEGTVVDLRDMSDRENFLDGTHFTTEAAAVAAERIAVVVALSQ